MSTFRFLTLFSFLLVALLAKADDHTCGPNKRCSIGCCGTGGFCGFGPDYCGSGKCTSDCDRKSQCDPGWGKSWSDAENCPLNVCCSPFGFCGTTSEFCSKSDKAVVHRPSCSGSSVTKRTIGYYEGWSSDRACDGVYPEQLNVDGYTHLNFAFAYIDPKTFQLGFMTPGDGELWQRLVALRETNPNLQVWLSVGGWSMNDDNQPTAKTFSEMAGDFKKQNTFISSLLQMLSVYGFDGVDIDWEYPVAPERSGVKDDFTNFPFFIGNLRNQITNSGYNYGLSITLPSSYWYMQNFDIVSIQNNVDWFNIMTYDIHGTWDRNNSNTGPYVQAHTNLTEIKEGLDLLWRNDIDPEKVTLGLGFYGRSFTLQDPSCIAPGCVFLDGGKPGPCTATTGILSYDEIMDKISHGAKVTHYEDAAVQVATFDGNQWVSYDDAVTFKQKIQFANDLCLGGTMVWAIDLDTSGTAISALSSSTGQQKRTVDTPDDVDTVQQCQWTDCINPSLTCVGVGGPKAGPCVQDCPDGWTTAWVNSGPGVCDDSFSSFRRFCCPKNSRTTCEVVKNQVGFCDGRCASSEVKIGTTTSDCDVGLNDICCTRSSSTEAQEECTWTNTCAENPVCPGNYPNMITSTPFGTGGQPCDGEAKKVLCCRQPSPYSNCKWNRGPFGGYVCGGTCSSSQTIVATSTEDCTSGSSVLCCDRLSKSAGLAQFELTLAAFVQNPSCPADTYIDDEPVPIEDGTPRDENADYKRDTSGVYLDYNFIARLAGSNSASLIDYQDAFNREVGRQNQDLSQYRVRIEQQPWRDPASIVQEDLCAWDHAQLDELAQDQAESQSCVIVGNPTKRSMFDGIRDIAKRVFHAALGTTAARTGRNSAINTGALLNAITSSTRTRYLYSRLLIYNEVEANLEVAYDLRNAPELQQRPGIDIFAVFHFHAPSLDVLRENPVAFVNVPRAHVFHGQGVYNANPHDRNNPLEWRVYSGFRTRGATYRGGANQRTIISNCPVNQQPMRTWYPGLHNDSPLNNFGSLLRAQGILRGETFHNWNNETNSFRWEDRFDGDLPNTGHFTNGDALAPVDMRPNDVGGSEGWVEVYKRRI